MTSIFIVVLNWNQPNLTLETIESLQKLKISKDIHVNLIVVDNGSTDNSLSIFRKLKPGKFSTQIMEARQNLGFAGGNNLGMQYAIEKKTDYVLVINNDTEVSSDLLTNLLKTIKEDEHIAAVSPLIYFAKGYEFHKSRYTKKDLGKVVWYAGGKIDFKNVYGSNNGVDDVDHGQYKKVDDTDFATGACVLYKVDALKDVGLFDKKYFLYMEDADLSMRLKVKGWRVVFDPGAKIWHKVSQSSGIGSDLNDYFIHRNRLIFGFRYAKFRTKMALLRESIKLFIFGRYWQAIGVRDFYLRKFGKGSWGR